MKGRCDWYSQVRIMNSMDRVEIEGMMVTAQIETSTGVLDTSFCGMGNTARSKNYHSIWQKLCCTLV